MFIHEFELFVNSQGHVENTRLQLRYTQKCVRKINETQCEIFSINLNTSFNTT